MRNISRTYKHTRCICDIADLNTGKVKTISYDLKSTYNDKKTLQTKLYNQLNAENKRLIQLKETRTVSITYFQKHETFKQHADYCTENDNGVIIKKQLKKEKTKRKGETNHG